jgi:hypothetical protein
MRDKLNRFVCSTSAASAHSFWRRVCLVLMLLLVALLLTGCDAFYDIVIENHTDQEVIVNVTGLGDFRMRPCSVQINSTVNSTIYKSIQVEIKDIAGNQMYNTHVKPDKKSEGIFEMYVRVPPEGSGACPAPVRGTFTLIVKNYLKQDASVWLDNVELGSVQALSTQTFGPLPGTWETKKKIKFLDSGGKPLLWAIDVDYNLGQVPQFFAYITPQ